MPKVRVTLKKRECVEYFVSHLVEVSDEDFAQLRDRPLQAKYWAEHVAPYIIDKEAWALLDDGRKMVNFDVLEVEMQKSAEPA